jgi:hypothetical protein
MKTATKVNPIVNFGYAILQFVIALSGASLVAWLLDNYVLASYRPTEDNGVIVLATWAIFFALLLFLVNRLTKQLRSNG